MAQHLNMGKLELEGEPIRVLDKVFDDESVWHGVFSVSNNGRIVYQNAGLGTLTRLQWFDRAGRTTGTVVILARISGLSCPTMERSWRLAWETPPPTFGSSTSKEGQRPVELWRQSQFLCYLVAG